MRIVKYQRIGPGKENEFCEGEKLKKSMITPKPLRERKQDAEPHEEHKGIQNELQVHVLTCQVERTSLS